MSKEDKIILSLGGGYANSVGAGPSAGKAARGKKDPDLLSGCDKFGMMPQSTALRTTLHWCRPWTFFHRWWTTPTPLGRSLPRTP